MRSGRPGPVLLDLPFDVQMTEIEFDIDLYQPLTRPQATRAQAVRALEMLSDARPVIIAGGGIINAEASELLCEFVELTGVPVIQTLRGWGALSDDHPLMIGAWDVRRVIAMVTPVIWPPILFWYPVTVGQTVIPEPLRPTPKAANSFMLISNLHKWPDICAGSGHCF